MLRFTGSLLLLAGFFPGPILMVDAQAQPQAQAGALDEIINFREYSATFASAGQPTEAQLSLIRDAGYERIVNIALTTDRTSIPGEDRLVRELGMDYIQIPVIWDSPTVADYEHFAAVMQLAPDSRTLLHCQANMRATAFSFLYRVIEQGVPMAEAKADLNSVWEPNPTWRELIFAVLDAHGLSPDCEGCSWGE